MELETSLTVAASGMRVQASRLRVVAENLANAQATAARIQTDVKRLLEDELNRARHQLRRETVEIAFALAERLLRERVEAADQRRLAEEYLKQIVQSTEVH